MKLPLKMNINTFIGELSVFAFRGVSSDMEYKEKKKIIDQNNIDYTRKQYEEMGIKIIDNDKLFYNIKLPDGWKVERGDEYWYYIYDDKGRRRINYFSKISSYDKDAFCNFYRRYSYSIDCKEESNSEKVYIASIIDCGKTSRNLLTLSIKNEVDEFKIMDVLDDAVIKIMNIEYPDWKNIHAYWD